MNRDDWIVCAIAALFSVFAAAVITAVVMG
jgi:hypothetical protein